MKAEALIGVPVYTLAAYKGMGDATAALRSAGIINALGSPSDKGDVKLPALNKDVKEGKTKNLSHFREATSRVYRAVKFLEAERVFVVGGECSLTVGCMAGLAEVFRGRPGMLWMDAHGDFNTPETSPSGYIGGMCLAMTCGRGPSFELGAHAPPLAEERLVHLGSRDLDPPEAVAFESSPAKLFTSRQVRRSGADKVAQEVARHLDDRSDWIACHLDVDVVDPEFFPSVNYPTPGGLTPREATTIIAAVLKTRKMKVLELAAYNASKDRGGSTARKIVEMLGTVFDH